MGLYIIFKPESFMSLNHKLNHWYSSRKSMKPFEIMRDTDSHVYRNNKRWGWTMLVGSGIFLYYFFSWQFPVDGGSLFFKTSVGAILAVSVLRTIWLFLALFIIAGLPVWILLIVDPERLKRVSVIFNRWLSTRLAFLPLVKYHFGFDEWIIKNNRVFGSIFFFGSIYILFATLNNI